MPIRTLIFPESDYFTYLPITEMFSKAFGAAILALTLTVQVHAHAAVAPVLGVAGVPQRSAVERPRGAKPCGNVDIAANLDTSTPVVVDADGSFTMTITNFNRFDPFA